MKKLHTLLAVTLLTISSSCTKSDNSTTTTTTPTTATITSKTVNATGFDYKIFYQETGTTTNRKGIVILAVGDGGTSSDGTLNDQCTALAQEGYVAITTTYRSLDNGLTWDQQGAQFKTDIEAVITASMQTYSIVRSKVIVGGLSRGGNTTLALILPSQFVGTTSFSGIKGAILQCSGGDEWKGSAVLFPVAYMSNKVDDTMGVADATVFNTGLQSNTNTDVKKLSECLIYNSTGHCSDISGNKAFIIKKVKEWLP